MIAITNYSIQSLAGVSPQETQAFIEMPYVVLVGVIDGRARDARALLEQHTSNARRQISWKRSPSVLFSCKPETKFTSMGDVNHLVRVRELDDELFYSGLNIVRGGSQEWVQQFNNIYSDFKEANVTLRTIFNPNKQRVLQLREQFDREVYGKGNDFRSFNRTIHLARREHEQAVAAYAIAKASREIEQKNSVYTHVPLEQGSLDLVVGGKSRHTDEFINVFRGDSRFSVIDKARKPPVQRYHQRHRY